MFAPMKKRQSRFLWDCLFHWLNMRFFCFCTFSCTDWCKNGVNPGNLRISENEVHLVLVELCACWNMVIYHQKMELFFAFLVVYRTDQHTAGVDLPIIGLGGRLVIAIQVLPTSSSGS